MTFTGIPASHQRFSSSSEVVIFLYYCASNVSSFANTVATDIQSGFLSLLMLF